MANVLRWNKNKNILKIKMSSYKNPMIGKHRKYLFDAPIYSVIINDNWLFNSSYKSQALKFAKRYMKNN